MEICSHKSRHLEELKFKGRTIKVMVCDECAIEAELKDNIERDNNNIHRSILFSGIPTYLINKLPLSTLDHQKRAKEIIDNLDTRSLENEEYPYLWGPNGTGKTMMSIALLHRLINKHKGRKSVRYVRIAELSRVSKFKLTETISSLASNHYAILIDDLGNHNTYDYTLEALIDIIEIRLASGKRTIITSNYKPTQLSEKLSQNTTAIGGINKNMCNAIVDRILELCNPVELPGSSLRIDSAIERIKGMQNGNK